MGIASPDAAIGWLIAAYTDGQIADEQMAAMAMAIYAGFRGMDDREPPPGRGR